MSAMTDAAAELFDAVSAEQDDAGIQASCDVERAAVTFSGIPVCKGFATVAAQLPDGGYITIPDDDFLIKVADWPLPTPPQQLDRITFDGVLFQVKVSEGERQWDWFDPTRTIYRIHTRQVQ